MSFNLETITGFGIPEDKAQEIIDRHEEVANEIKAERDAMQQSAKEVRRLMGELEAAKAGEDWKAKYEEEKAAFDALKAEQEAKQAEERKREAYKELCRAEGVRARRLDSIARIIDVSSFRIDAAGNLENPDAIRADIRREWEDLIPAKGKGGYWHG